MALESNAQKELDKLKKIEEQTDSLRTRMENDFSLFRLNKFEIPKEEGEWENFTTNTPAILGRYVINNLAYAKRRLWIPVVDEKEEKRKILANTERLAIGSLELADNISDNTPDVVNIQYDEAFFAAIRGWRVIRIYVHEEDGKVIPDVAVWDPLNTFWISGGRKGLLWVCHRRFASKEQIEDEYGKDLEVEEDSFGRIIIYDVWDKDEFGTVGGDVPKYLRKPEKHGKEYIPVRIKPVGAMPFVQSIQFDDTIKDVGESCFANNRNIYPLESRLLSYNLTRAGKIAKTPSVILFDSTKDPQSPELQLDPEVKGTVLFLDKGKGQELGQRPPEPTAQDINLMRADVSAMISMGGVAPVALGQINSALPAQGIDILTHSALSILKPFKQAMEADFKWMAEEVVRQFKQGKFGELELEGYDKSSNKFRAKVSADDVDENWKFECELVPDLLRDEVAIIGAMIQATKARLLSRQTAREKAHLVDDTDLEQQIVDREEAEDMIQVKLLRLAAALKEDGDELGYMAAMQAYMSAGMGAGQPQGQPQPGGGGQLPGAAMPPQLMAGNMQNPSNIPPEIRQAARMKKMGLVTAR